MKQALFRRSPVTRLFLLLCLTLHTSTPAAEDDLQLWTPVTLQIPVNERLYLSTVTEPRLGNNLRDMSTLILRPGVYYQVNDHVTAGITGEYTTGYIPTFREDYRIGEEVLVTHRLGKLNALHRLRLDQRWVGGADMSVRVRIRNKLTYPLPKTRWYLVGFNEYLFNLYTVAEGTRQGFDQNRLFLGVGRSMGRRTTVEGGYLLVALNGPRSGVDQWVHTIYLNLLVNLRE